MWYCTVCHVRIRFETPCQWHGPTSECASICAGLLKTIDKKQAEAKDTSKFDKYFRSMDREKQQHNRLPKVRKIRISGSEHTRLISHQ